jgi:adenylyltransferase/sulfurtransferase
MLPVLSPQEVLRYSRHLMLPEVGMSGQKKLKSASILIVGAGGLGSPAALYLAAAGVGKIGLVDFDTVSKSNLQRQVLFAEDQVGRIKVEEARKRLLSLNSDIDVRAYHSVFSSENAFDLLKEFDFIVDGADNYATRYLVNDVSVLMGKPYVYGAIYRFDGQVGVFDARKGACYRCLFAQPPAPELSPTCAEGGVLGVLPGMVGTIQASEAIKLITGIGEPAINKLLMVDALNFRFDVIQLRKNPACKICGDTPEIHELVDYAAFCGAPIPGGDEHADLDMEITAQQLADKLRIDNYIKLIDVRNAVEAQISAIAGARLIPYDQITSHLDEFNQDDELVLFCRTGTRSLWALKVLREAGFTKARHLAGGINAWAREIDNTIRQY